MLALEQSFAFLARDRHKFDTICNRVKSSSDEDRPLLVGGRHGLRSGDGKPYPPATATAIPSIRRRPVLTGFIVGSAGLADASTVRCQRPVNDPGGRTFVSGLADTSSPG